MPSRGPTGRPEASKTALTPVSVAWTTGRPDSAARTAAREACWAGAQLCWKVEVEDWATISPAPARASRRLRSGKAVSKQTSGPVRSPPEVSITTCRVPGCRSSPAARPTEVAQPSSDRAGTYSPKGTSRILSYRGPAGPEAPTSTEVLEIPGRPRRRASTLTSSSAPVRRDRAASRPARSGRAARSKPTELSPHTTSSAPRPASPAVSRSCRSNRWAAPGTTPGCTTAIRAGRSAGTGRGAAAATPVASAATAAPAARVAHRARGEAATTTRAVLTATSSRLTSQTPPTGKSRSAGPTCH